jgi:NAD(P)-dependent dehydrogenase (short-subunit alcohol dehydrogenase family)
MTTNKTVALITGANKGIGLEIARQLGKLGFTVVIGARDEARGRDALEKLRLEQIDAHVVKLEVQSQADVDALPKYFREKFGRLDVLVNNAGIAEWSSDDVATFRRTLDANVVGVVAVTYALLPLIKESPAGRIVNQSSELGSLTRLTVASEQFAAFINPAYTTSKAALNGFTVALAVKLKGTHVKVNSAHAGWVKTDLGSDAAPMDVVDGAKTAVMLATLAADGPTGGFFHMGNSLPW